MRKILILSLAAMAGLAFSGCSGDETDSYITPGAGAPAATGEPRAPAPTPEPPVPCTGRTKDGAGLCS